MPGLRIVCALPPHRLPPASAEGADERFLPRAGSTIDPVHADERVVIEVERPAWYPCLSNLQRHVLVCVEGHTYGAPRSSLIESLNTLPLDPREEDNAFAVRVRSCAANVDGDFVALLYDVQAARWCLAGDRFGRLPVYYHASETRVVAARHPGFVHAHLGDPAIDRTGLAQLLLLGYPLGDRTLMEGVKRLLPGEALVVSSRGCRIVPPAASPFRRDAARRVPSALDACARELRDAFVGSCRDRHVEGHHHVLSLSGGMDSRTVGAGMRSAFGGLATVSFVAPGSPHADERASACEVARALDAPWKAYELDHADPRRIDEIVRLKLGLNPADVAFGLEYVERVQSDFAGPVAFWTGEGADKLLCEHRAIPRRPGPDDLVRFIVAKNAVWEPAAVSALVGVHPDDLAAGVRSAVAAARDIEPEDAYVHFLLSQRLVRWHFEGEDRHRACVWPVAPFLGREFVQLARAIPGGRKGGRRLYRAFLRTLAPDIAALPLPGERAAPASFRFAVEQGVRDRLRNNALAFGAYRRLRLRRRAREAYGEIWRRRLEAYRADVAVPSPFEPSAVRRVASGEMRAPWNALALLLTALAAVETIRR